MVSHLSHSHILAQKLVNLARRERVRHTVKCTVIQQASKHIDNGMRRNESLRVAFSGLLAMAAALGIARFVYTPILPFMLDALRWSKGDAGLVASANFHDSLPAPPIP